MKLILDNIIFNLQKSGGISVYWYEILNRILGATDMTSLLIGKGNTNNLFSKKLEINDCDVIKCTESRFDLFSRYRPIKLKIRNEKFVFHSSYYRTLEKNVKRRNSVKEVVTVHDFTYEHFIKGPKKWIHVFQKKKAIAAADIIICISESTKKDLLHFYPQFANKEIRIIYNGVSSDYFKLPESETIGKSVPFFLFVGSRTGYKNFNFTVRAVAQTNDFMLKIVGGKVNEKELSLLNEKLPNRWELIENADNSALNKLYNEAFSLVYPSSYEGFGIPLVEAMKAGCPFITLNTSSIPEVAGDAGILLNNLDLALFNEAVNEITNNREKIVELGFIQANKFSWQKCYEETYKVYNDLYNSLN